MRTCPDCAEDIPGGAGKCPYCGFSFSDALASEREATGAARDTSSEPPSLTSKEATAPAAVAGAGGCGGCLGFLVVIGIIGFIIFGGSGSDKSGPTPGEVEDAIVEKGNELDANLTADCPDSSEDTEEGETFTCIASNEGGDSVQVRVTNEGDSFSYPGKAVVALMLGDIMRDSPATFGPDDCIIITPSGNQLCGDQAIAYCYDVPTASLTPEANDVCLDVLRKAPAGSP